MQETKFIYLETYGCSANLNNAEIMKGIIRQAGLELTNNPDIADILIINTCIVKEPTEKKIERRISDLRKKYSKPIIIAGCMSEIKNKNLEKENIFLLGIHHVKDIAKLIRKIQENNYSKNEFLAEKKEEKLGLPKIPEIKKIGITQISEGCLGNCSFCITRLAKGKLFSYPQENIIENIKSDLNSGCKEIWLTSQDNAAYGLDSGKRNLPELLNKILEIKAKFKIRIGMMNPENVLPILDNLIDVSKNEKIYKFLHLPLQSGSNRILKLMNRKYKVEDFLKIIKEFKKEIPDITISTDIIVAFPEENEEDFLATLKIIKEIKPDVLNISKFWKRKNTEAEKMSQLPRETARARAGILMTIFKEIIKEKNQKLIGKETTALVYDRFQDYYLARNPSYKLVLIKTKENILGKIMKVKIIKQEANHLLGEMIG